jgi:gluconolactonase
MRSFNWPISALAACLAGSPNAFAQSQLIAVDPQAVYPEGPLWKDGTLYFVEYGGPGVKRVAGKVITVHWSQEHCGASGLIGYADTHMLVACYDANAIVEIDGTGHTVRTIDRDAAGNAFIGPNDFAADTSGGIYFSASGVYDLAAPITGAVLYLPPGGGAPREVAGTIHYSNGLTVSGDGKQLLVAEMLAGRILSFPIGADGSLGPRTVWARLRDLARSTGHEDGYNGPDGLKLGPDGNYYIAQNGSGRVLVVSPTRKLVRVVRVPTPYVTNVNFGGDGARTLFITGVFDPWKAPYPGVVYRWTNAK